MAEVNIPNYQPNSHKYKREQAEKEKKRTKHEPVAKAKASAKKDDKVSIVKDRVVSAGDTVLKTVIVPTVLKLLYEAGSTALRSVLFPNEKGTSGKRYFNYDRPSYRDVDSRVINTDERRRVKEDIILESEEDAEAVIDALADMIERYGQASIADLYDLVDKTADYTEYKYGWKSVRNFGIRMNRYDEAVLKIPRAVLLD